jgi:hypothetical protein
MGGEKAVQEVIEVAAREGGEQLAERLTATALTHGPAIIRGARVSPARFLAAFESVEPALKEAALQGIRREPELMARMVAEVGREALMVEAKHPGVGVKVLQSLGAEGAVVAAKLPTDEAIRLTRIAPKVASVPAGERSELLRLIGQAPGRTLSLLERHPNVLTTGALLTAFLASKQELLGNEELVVGPEGSIRKAGKPGLISRILAMFHEPIALLFYAIGAAIVLWSGIKLWGTYRITRAKVAAECPQKVNSGPH